MTPECFQQVADRIPDPLLMVEPATGDVLAANAPAATQLGLAPGTSLLARAADPDALGRFLALAARSSQPIPGRVRLADRDETWRCAGSLARAPGEGPATVFLHLRTAAGAAGRFVALNEQIERLNAEMRRRQALEEERRELLDNERRAREDAEEASRLKDEFLAALSHELRTPLHAITGWLDLLKTRRTPEVLERALEVLERNVAAQTQLTEDLVDVSRIISGRMRLSLAPVDLAEVVRHAIESARPAAEAKGVRLEVVADTGGCVVNADPDRMLQIVWNLLSNATKFTEKGGRIQVLVRRINSHAEVIVSDTGEGIPPAVLPYVFDRFRQADGSTTRRHGGLGLGLAIVRHLVELHGGVVLAHSDGPGRGATFTVNLPLPIFERKPALSPLPEGPGAIRSPTANDLVGCRVLLVEDHEDSRDLLESILAASGAEVVATARAEEAMATLDSTRPDVIVSDIELPGEDGFTLMRKIRDLEKGRGLHPVPAIAVTAHTLGEARLHALRAGYQSFLIKPIHPPELVAMVKSLCELRSDDDHHGPGGV